MTVDAAGNTYLTGARKITQSTATSLSTDIFVTKVDASGNVIRLASVGGKGSNQANGIALDAVGNIYLVGDTMSTDFPLQGALQSTPPASGNASGFLMKLDSAGNIIYSTYLGGTRGWSSLTAVATDAAGNAYVTV